MLLWQSIFWLNCFLQKSQGFLAKNLTTDDAFNDTCIRAIVKRYFNPIDLTMLWTNEKTQYTSQSPAIIQYFDPRTPNITYPIIRNYLIYTTNNNLRNILNFLRLRNCLNGSAKYLILVLKEELQREMFAILAEFYIIHVAVLDNTGQIYTYFPYPSEDIYDYSSVKFDAIAHCSNTKHPGLFRGKLPKFWRNSTLNIAYLSVPPFVVDPQSPTFRGLEVLVMEEIAAVLQFDMNFTRNPALSWGQKTRNASYDGVLGMLQRHQVSVAMGAFFSKAQESCDFDMASAGLIDTMHWVVPTACKVEHWKAIVRIFPFATMMALLSTVASIATIVYFLAQKSRDLRQFRDLFNNLLVFFVMLFGSPHVVSVVLWKHRSIFLAYLFVSVIITTCYTSHLVDFLTGDLYEKQIDSFEEILESNLKIGLSADVAESFRDDATVVVLQICDFSRACLNQSAFERNWATNRGSLAMSYMIPMFYLDAEGRPMLHMITKSPFLHFNIVWYFVKNFPMIHRINELLLALNSNGIIVRVIDMAEHQLWIRNGVNIRRDIESRALTIQHMQGALFLLVLGYLASLGIFFGEVYFGRK